MTGRRAPHYQQAIPFRLVELSPTREVGGDRSPAPRGEAAPDALSSLRARAERGAAEAIHLLGVAYFRGEFVARDLAEARRLQARAAALGSVEAQFELSVMLETGVGGPANARGARQWEARAADAGHPRACVNRGARLARGRRPDFLAVARWYERAADAGSAEAAARLCQMHLVGQGVAADEVAARRWYERAAALGHDWSAAGPARPAPNVEGGPGRGA